jgi:hypothetical protein
MRPRITRIKRLVTKAIGRRDFYRRQQVRKRPAKSIEPPEPTEPDVTWNAVAATWSGTAVTWEGA